MNKQTHLGRTLFHLPVRVTFDTAAPGGVAIVERSGQSDAGWTILTCDDLAHARRIMTAYPAARMPCWARIEAETAHQFRQQFSGDTKIDIGVSNSLEF